MATVNEKDMETINIARKYGLVPGTIKCEVFILFEQGFSLREVKFILRDFMIDSQDKSFSNTIRRYYYTWKHFPKNLPTKG